MKEIKQIDIISMSKMTAVLSLLLITIAAVITSLLTNITGFLGEIPTILFGIIVGTIFNVIIVAIGAWVYNFVATKIGGIKIVIE